MNVRRRLLAAAVAAAVAATYAGATQNELVPPTSGTYTGVAFSQLLGDAFRSLASGNKGSAAPANVSGGVVDGLPWIDDSVSPWLVKVYANGNWLTRGAIDQTNGIWVGSIGGGTASLASASTADLGSVPQANVTITGTTTITAFGSSAPTGAVKIVRFAAALSLTHSSNLKVPGGYDLTTAADDRMIVTHLGSGAWEITQYTRADGVPVDVSAVGDIKYGDWAAAPAHYVLAYGQALTRTTYPAYLAKVTRAQNGTRTSGNATIASVSDTSGMGAGMPAEGTGISAGCTIASVTASTIVLNSSGCVTSSGTATVTVFFTGYGSGGSGSTVGVRDCRNLVMAGRGNLGGSDRGLLTTGYFGADPTVLNALGGAEKFTLAQTALPNVALSLQSLSINILSGATTAYAPSVADNSTQFATGVGNPAEAFGAGVFRALSATLNSGATSSLNGGAGQTSVANTPPTGIANCAVRVEP